MRLHDPHPSRPAETQEAWRWGGDLTWPHLQGSYESGWVEAAQSHGGRLLPQQSQPPQAGLKKGLTSGIKDGINAYRKNGTTEERQA
jgi:hypothetical protein